MLTFPVLFQLMMMLMMMQNYYDADADDADITRNEASSPRNPCNNQLLIHVSCTQQSDSHVQLTCSTCMVSPAVLVGYEPL